MPPALIALLAAGSARRFGGGKLDAPLLGRPLGLWALEQGLALGAPLVVVRGAQAPLFLPADVPQIINPAAHSGLGSSLALAARAAVAQGAGRLVVMLADMPFVSAECLRFLLDAEGRAASAYDETGAIIGPPAAFPAPDFAALAQLDPQTGAGGWLRSLPDVALWPLGLRERMDVDTPEDLARAAQSA